MTTTRSNEVSRSEVQQHELTKENLIQRDDLGAEIDRNAVGGTFGEMPKGYYLTASFLATFIATCLGVSCFKLGYVLPVNTLSIINADIGMFQDSIGVKVHLAD